jgi:hypothetical protein
MKKYIIVANVQTSEVEREVSKLLNEGWKLAGGISMTYKHEHSDHGHVPGHLTYAQALEKAGD